MCVRDIALPLHAKQQLECTAAGGRRGTHGPCAGVTLLSKRGACGANSPCCRQCSYLATIRSTCGRGAGAQDRAVWVPVDLHGASGERWCTGVGASGCCIAASKAIGEPAHGVAGSTTRRCSSVLTFRLRPHPALHCCCCRRTQQGFVLGVAHLTHCSAGNACKVFIIYDCVHVAVRQGRGPLPKRAVGFGARARTVIT